MPNKNSIDQKRTVHLSATEKVDLSFHTCELCKQIMFDMTVTNRQMRTRLHMSAIDAERLAAELIYFAQLSKNATEALNERT